MLVVAQWVGCGRGGMILEGMLKEKRIVCQASKENGA